MEGFTFIKFPINLSRAMHLTGDVGIVVAFMYILGQKFALGAR